MRQTKKIVSMLLVVTFLICIFWPPFLVRAEEEEEKISPVNFVFIDKPRVETGETQHMAVSLAGIENNIESATLVYTDSAGNEYEIQSVVAEDDIIGFEQEFSGETPDTYFLSSIHYTIDGMSQEIIFSDYGINAFFGLNQDCTEELEAEYEELSLGEEDIIQDNSVVSVVSDQDDGELKSEEEISNIVEEALSSAGVGPLEGSEEAVIDYGQEDVELDGEEDLEALGTFDSSFVVVLDPGHCDLHLGANQNGIAEHVPVLKIAQYCKAELETYANVKVLLTRNSAACPFPESGGAIQDIYDRVDWAAKQGADVYISFHLDSAGSTSTGSHVFYPSPEYASASVADAGGQLAQQIQNQLINLGLYDRGVKPWDFAVNTRAAKHGFPGVLIEHCFLSNPKDVEKYISTDAKLKTLGQADANGIARYYGLRKKSTTSESVKINSVSPDEAKKNLFGSQIVDVTGKNRTETSLLLADKVKKILKINKFNTIILADGRNFPDGIAVSQLSAKLYAPVLLITPGTEESVRQYIVNNLVPGGNIYVAGGEGAVPNSAVVRLKSYGTVKRFAGAGRYDTNMLILNEMMGSTGGYDELVVASGNDFPDALCVTAIGKPIMIVRNSLDEAQKGFLGKGFFKKITVIGGTGVVTEEVRQEIYEVTGIVPKRLGGKGRVETAKLVAKEYFSSSSCLVYTKGSVFADGLSAGLIANLLGSPLLLTLNASDMISASSIVTVGGVKVGSSGNTASSLNKIEGSSLYTAERLASFYKSYCSQYGISYPAYYAKNDREAKTIDDFCRIYVEEANAEGIRAEVAFCQAMLETGYLKFGGDVNISQFNFAGIGATGGGEKGNSFSTVRLGIRAQVQHLKAYASTAALNNACVDPRFHFVKRGSAPYVEWLGIKENPNGSGWASAVGYGNNILKLMKAL